jgi:diamine N-acetyltransferase
MFKTHKKYCFNNLKFHRIWLDVFDDNERAIALYKSEGFKVDGHLRDVIKQSDIYRTLILLSILENESYEK